MDGQYVHGGRGISRGSDRGRVDPVSIEQKGGVEGKCVQSQGIRRLSAESRVNTAAIVGI